MLKVENLKKIYKSNGKRTEALMGISFSMNKGEIVGLLGPNGAGKTTTFLLLDALLRTLLGFYQARQTKRLLVLHILNPVLFVAKFTTGELVQERKALSTIQATHDSKDVLVFYRTEWRFPLTDGEALKYVQIEGVT